MNCRYKEIESFFKMPFAKIISELHMRQSRSIHSLVKESGISHTSFVNLARSLGIELRTHKQSSRLNMSLNNPTHNVAAKEKRARTLKRAYSKSLWPQEIVFKKILDKQSVRYEMQSPIGPYNIDFFLKDIRLCIEIDSTDKWGKERRAAANKKDKVLIGLGYKVLRINKRKLTDLLFINNILKANNVI